MQALREHPENGGIPAESLASAALKAGEIALVWLESILYYLAIVRGGTGQQDSVKTYMVNL
jgi:hypothetical protein